MQITIGELDDKLKLSIFDEDKNDPYYLREKQLKEHIKITFHTTMELVQMPEETSETLSYYKQERIKKNIKNLSDYVGYLANELDEEKIKKYVDKQSPFHINIDIDASVIISNSYYGSIKHDIYWIDELKYIDALQISKSDFDIKRLNSYLPNSVNHFKKVIIPYFKSDSYFSDFNGILAELQETIKNKTFRAANLLIITVIEGIVRKIGAFLIDKQNLNINPDDKNFNSLDSFLRKIEWKKDYVISKTRFRLKTASFEYNRGGKFNDEMLITLKERLDFLRRRFKENRDLILHGSEKDYNTDWNLFINLSALKEVCEVVQEYRKLYK